MIRSRDNDVVVTHEAISEWDILSVVGDFGLSFAGRCCYRLVELFFVMFISCEAR